MPNMLAFYSTIRIIFSKRYVSEQNKAINRQTQRQSNQTLRNIKKANIKYKTNCLNKINSKHTVIPCL